MKLLKSILSTLFLLSKVLIIAAQNSGPDATINRINVEFIVQSKSKATERVISTITVYNKNGDQFAFPYVSYDKFIKVKKFDCTQTDLAGQVLKKFKNNEIKDESTTSAGTVFDDNRVKYVEVLNNNYPYRVTFEYEREYNGLFHYPYFSPQPGYNVNVEESRFHVIVPKELGLRFKVNNTEVTPIQEETDENLQFTWNLNDIEALEEEILSPSGRDILPTIYLGANEFEYDGFAGNMNSWTNFGNWLYQLLPVESNLNEPEKSAIRNLVSSCKNEEEKIRTLYEYMQSKTRYVSIQLGIGGFQPMPPDKVSELGYGDCKALSNYMRTILAEAGILSYYTIIGGGKNHSSFTFTDFPNSFQANHVILSVPVDHDTIFLECTSQKNPCGYLGSFTGNRNALLISEEGGKLIRTASYQIDDYLHQSVATYTVNNDGSLSGTCEKLYKGVAYEEVEGNQDEDQAEVRKQFLKDIDNPGFDLKSITYNYKKERLPEMREEIDFTIASYAQMSGDRMFFAPNLFSKWDFQLPKNENRRQPIVIRQPYFEIDTVIFNLPKDYNLEATIEPVQLQTEFGSYKIEANIEDSKLFYIRELKIYRDQYPRESYTELRSFFREISKADKSQIVLVKQKT